MDRGVTPREGEAALKGWTAPLDREVPLAPRTSWRIGGPARWLARPGAVAELAALLARWPPEWPLLLLGGGSNLLVDDPGFHGLVVTLGGALAEMTVDPERGEITAGGGANSGALAHLARRHGLAGAEFLGGIPGTVGGALRMNAGAYGGEMADMVVAAELLDRAGNRHRLARESLGLGYRHSGIPADWVVVAVQCRLPPGDPAAIRGRMRDNNRRRRESQPLGYPSAGSVFKNPPGGEPAWRLIQRAGMQGVREGAAQVSERHANFLVNRGGATAAQVRRLMARVREAVRTECGVALEPEVKRLCPTGWWVD